MTAPSHILRAARPLFRQQGRFQAQTFFRQNINRNGNAGSKRWQSSTASDGAGESWFKKAWESEVGIKTVHFWAPVMKWALVLAGISDLARPAEKLSFTQNFALTCTGIIWTRWCFVITPKNYLLAAVNFFLGLVGIAQITRIAMYQSSLKDGASAIEEIKDEVKEKVKA